MNLHLIGDIHGMFEEYYLPITSRLNDDPSIQIGDMGHGFPNSILPELPKQHRFIRGNHDNPELCLQHPNYLGEFGYIEEWDLFYIGGAWSIDWQMRKRGVTWWEDEELTMKQCNAALDLYLEKKPFHVVSHDCPEIAKISMLIHIAGSPNGVFNMPTRTNQLLQEMWEQHQPANWYFGHYHVSRKFKIKATSFRCLGEAEVLEIAV